MKLIKDPIYGGIEISPAEERVLNTPVVLRLSRVKQLSLVYLVYPSANHTRLEHSLGVMHLAGLMGGRLGLSEDDIRTVRMAGLLHDVGHGPFSHCYDHVLRVKVGGDHRHFGARLVKENAELRGALGKGSYDVDRLCRLIGEEDRTILNEILHYDAALNADVMDYLLRDSHHTGTSFGAVDVSYILNELRADGERVYSGRDIDRFLSMFTWHEDRVYPFEACRVAYHEELYGTPPDPRLIDNILMAVP